MILDKTGYSYNDLTIVPANISDIKSRKECDPFINGKLPIFASPMSTVTNESNIDLWEQNGITPIIPRNVGVAEDNSNRIENILHYLNNGVWCALSLNEFTDVFITNYSKLKDSNCTYKVCIDLANGHMQHLYTIINKAKQLSKENRYKLIVMTGNIANPKTYDWICRNAEVDYIRLSIGSGYNCITSSNSSVHYPIATLIDECYKIKMNYKWYISKAGSDNNIVKSLPAIVADGGVRGYADVIKALALGADYVMIGSMFTKLLESAAPFIVRDNAGNNKQLKDRGNIYKNIDELFEMYKHNYVAESRWNEYDKQPFDRKLHDIMHSFQLYKESYGMSTKKAQLLINPTAETKTSEGCTKMVLVKETVRQWIENMTDYLRSAMSYTNCRSLDEFIGKVTLIANSSSEIRAVNK